MVINESNITPIVKQLKNLNIVIVEDDRDNRRKIEQMLDKYGFYKRSFYSDAKDALDAIMTGSVYDLIIINWHLKNECKAVNFCRKVSKLGKSMPLIFITSTSLKDYYEAFHAGATNVIKQPFDERDFLESVWSAIDIEAFRRELRAKDLNSLRKKAFFRLQQVAAKA